MFYSNTSAPQLVGFWGKVKHINYILEYAESYVRSLLLWITQMPLNLKIAPDILHIRLTHIVLLKS